jgi:hypothetical protein
MRYRLASLCFLSLLLFAATTLAQNGDYSSYYSYTVTPNPDGSATVIPTAEVTGIDDVSDWVEGQYRPVCTVRPKIQLTGDSAWVGGSRVALGHAVDQVRTGQGLQVPANGSTVNLQFAVEVDANCSGAPSPSYYLYPTIANLNTWADFDTDIWALIGFEPAQTNPPYWSQYCPSGDLCSVGYGVASIRNFVDFADFWDMSLHLADTLLKMIPGTETNCFQSLGITWCDYSTVTWCTPATTPPDYNPPGVHDVPKATPAPAYYWVTHSFGVSYTGGPPYTYIGLIPDWGYPGPDNTPRGVCTKTY